MDKHIIYGVHVTNRMNKATNVQQLFSEYGCNIKTRIGLHDVGKDFCSPSGVILLEMFGDESVCEEPVSYTHLRAHETPEHLVCRLLLEKKNKRPTLYSHL